MVTSLAYEMMYRFFILQMMTMIKTRHATPRTLETVGTSQAGWLGSSVASVDCSTDSVTGACKLRAEDKLHIQIDRQLREMEQGRQGEGERG